MVWVLVLAAALWFLGARIGAPASARWMMIGLLYVGVLALLVLFPPGHPVQATLGGSVGEWLVLGVLAALIFGYTQVLGRVRAKARGRDAVPAPVAGAYAPGEVERYARHILLREIGGPGQKALKQGSVLVVGAGGLGSPALMYLAAAGVGRIGVIDDDAVEATNLQRQIVHADARVGMPKVFSAEAGLRALNPYVDVRPYHRRLTAEIAVDLVAEYDIVLDGTDDVTTRYVVNRACVETQTPLVSGALSQWEGQVSLFDPANGTPCYRCLFPEPAAAGLAPTCAEAGVLGPLPGIVGSIMAAEAVKALTGAGETLAGRMLIYDALYADCRVIALKSRADCPDCMAARG